METEKVFLVNAVVYVLYASKSYLDSSKKIESQIAMILKSFSVNVFSFIQFAFFRNVRYIVQTEPVCPIGSEVYFIFSYLVAYFFAHCSQLWLTVPASFRQV
ncbi:hypothetical protein NA23_00665 [Fervidobacterium islandicum]|uniref:Uncharacterized protein n=1 Tax=Fervidobacterium islandicum TaxID=2423 RepID=A0AAI8CKH0_FERIS|nr:hypothetical protein [Fervidobacterium islandicum]AMW31997.1 hypothetical protein NA23_00665 [Fervidobacterium islandicum]